MINMKTMFGDVKKAAADMFADNITAIDIDELHESPDNPFDVVDVEEFAEVIYEQGGVMTNLTVTKRAEGGYEIIGGHRRTAAIRYLLSQGRSVSRFLPCHVKNYGNDEEKRLDIILMNISARTITDAELYKSYEIMNEALQRRKALGERFGRVRERLAEMLNVSTGKVSQLENINNNAIPAVKQALENGDITVNTASELAKLDIEKQDEIVANTEPKELTPNVIKNCAKFDTNDESEDIDKNLTLGAELGTNKKDADSATQGSKKRAKLGTNLTGNVQRLSEKLSNLKRNNGNIRAMLGYDDIDELQADITELSLLLSMKEKYWGTNGG